MGIYDREYIRGGSHSSSGFGSFRMWSVNTWIIAINIAVFVIDAILVGSGVTIPTVIEIHHQVLADGTVTSIPITRGLPPLQSMFHFSTALGFFRLEVWRLIGFQFLHGGVNHLFFNMLGLYFFGGLVENYLGGKRYLAFYLVCGLFGGVTYLLLNLLGNIIPGVVPGLLINDIYTPLIGASAGVFGVLIASAFIAPNAIVLLFFILPMKLWQVAYGFVILAAINLLSSGANAGGDAAHIGGAVAGFYFIRHTHLLRDFFEFFAPRKKSAAGSANKPAASFKNRRTPDDTEIDRILAKIATHGLQSLTDGEKRLLRRASESRRR